jgi:hypothetical protein
MGIEDVKKLKGLLLDDEGLIDVVRVALSNLFGEENVLWRRDGMCYDKGESRYCEVLYIVKADSGCYKVIAVIDFDEFVVADVRYEKVSPQICEL